MNSIQLDDRTLFFLRGALQHLATSTVLFVEQVSVIELNSKLINFTLLGTQHLIPSIREQRLQYKPRHSLSVTHSMLCQCSDLRGPYTNHTAAELVYEVQWFRSKQAGVCLIKRAARPCHNLPNASSKLL